MFYVVAISMKNFLFDSSAWIHFFNDGIQADELEFLILEDKVRTNDVVLCEVLPFLHPQKQKTHIELIRSVICIPLHIDWVGIREKQVENVANGINGVGLPDLIIWQQVEQHADLELYTLDKQFELLGYTKHK